ncbi:hypothetical protein [Aeromicrobium fastidiosum]|uniref:Uncharacterized protein n=1 Tax=Aeromicrobium fastidiosum TaxID=52699 RepID=A0A641AKK7_9ACTN|nr:hypothetical protein [Aeromicrobium fastidiosum]KAA1376371.1 hypothetical protein ESP62_013130 [Aeromicrobium fastidiosum]MBP2391727.1 hypothetical protein [Aeromicrobium fastidiosum]
MARPNTLSTRMAVVLCLAALLVSGVLAAVVAIQKATSHSVEAKEQKQNVADAKRVFSYPTGAVETWKRARVCPKLQAYCDDPSVHAAAKFSLTMTPQEVCDSAVAWATQAKMQTMSVVPEESTQPFTPETAQQLCESRGSESLVFARTVPGRPRIPFTAEVYVVGEPKPGKAPEDSAGLFDMYLGTTER